MRVVGWLHVDGRQQMRWDALFADLEAQAAMQAQAQRAAEVEERTRAEVGALRVTERLRGALGAPLRFHVAGAGVVSGTLSQVGADWVLLDEGAGREVLLASAALVRVSGLTRHSAADRSVGVVQSRLGLRHVLRAIGRDRSGVALHLRDSTVLSATIDRVGADFVEAALHSPGEPRRRTDVREVALVVLAELVAVRRQP
jgi:hypothetical protein